MFLLSVNYDDYQIISEGTYDEMILELENETVKREDNDEFIVSTEYLSNTTLIREFANRNGLTDSLILCDAVVSKIHST